MDLKARFWTGPNGIKSETKYQDEKNDEAKIRNFISWAPSLNFEMYGCPGTYGSIAMYFFFNKKRFSFLSGMGFQMRQSHAP